MQLTLQEMGHPIPKTDIWVDNTTTVGIANSTVKQQRSRAMNMRYFWVIDQVNMKYFRVRWAPGLQNLADYFTKHHTAAHHLKVRPYYVHMSKSAHYLTQAPSPRDLRGCVECSKNGWGFSWNQAPLVAMDRHKV